MIAGCGRSPYELAPVTGTVLIDGQAVTNVNVMFAPIARGEDRNAGKPAFGRVNADGRFTLTTYHENDGAVIGEHWVTIIKLDEESAADAGIISSGSQAKRASLSFDRVSVPRKVTVAAGPNDIEIKLTAQEVARFGRRED